jgi:hypothetical protein
MYFAGFSACMTRGLKVCIDYSSIPIFLQLILNMIKSEINSDSEKYLASSENGNQLVGVNHEEAPTCMSLQVRNESEVSSAF